MPTQTSQNQNANNLSDEQKSVIQPIRTYERDVAEALRASGASVVSINLKQHEVQEPPRKPMQKIDRVEVMPQSPVKAQPNVAPLVVPLQKNPPPAQRQTLEQRLPKRDASVPAPQPAFIPQPPPPPPQASVVRQVDQMEVPPPEMNALRKQNEGKHYVYLEKEEVAKKSIFFLLSIVLLVAGVSAIGVIYFLKINQEPVQTIIEPSSVITTEYRENGFFITLSKSELVRIVNEIKADKRPSSSITEISFVDEASASENAISAETFVGTVAPTAPGNLLRAFDRQWLFGLYARGEINEPVILVKINSFENVFDGMLAWETSMASELQDFFPVRTMSTSTAPRPTISGSFEDIVIKNKDARVLKNSFGENVLIYSFLDEQTLAITWSREGLEELITRYFVNRSVR